MQLVIIRGLPGAGKSTYAKKNFPFHKHFEADMYFCRDGDYKFDPTKLNAAHRWCQGKVNEALANRKDVVVSNTFIQEWEFDAYKEIAHNHGCRVLIVELKTQFQNIHGVPEDKLEMMKRRWTELEHIAREFLHIDCEYEIVYA